nr:GTPase [Aeromicrobium duanguangcaii]
MGRTMAGKSSLLAALTGSHFDRIGDGRQRFSRDTLGAVSSASASIEVVDTPGVGAHGGADDTEVALGAALTADVVVWVNSSDSIQEESARALKVLGVIGKPIIVVLNCRQSLEGVGKLNLLRFPERVFGHKEGLVQEIRRHMAQAGVEPLDVVYVHALAAVEAQSRTELDTELHAASRIDDLTDALLRENATHSESRRMLRFVDGHRQRAEELALSLRLGSTSLRTQADTARGLADDVHGRLSRIVRATREAMAADIEGAVGRRRDWHLHVTDFGTSLESEWSEEMTVLQRELHKILESRLLVLTNEIKSTIQATDTEWTDVSPDQFSLHDLAGFDSVWGNRLVKAGVGVAGSVLGFSGGALLGAQIGLALGLPTGPGAIVTTGVGFVVGGIATLGTGRAKNLADRIFLGTDGVLSKRRSEVSKRVGPILDELALAYQAAVSAQLDGINDALARERAQDDERTLALDHVSSRWAHLSRNLQELVRELDRETAKALLRIGRRERLARSVRRATRVPGVCILVEYDDAAFWESWLYPPDAGENVAGGKATFPRGEAAGALTYALSLVEAPTRLVGASDATALLSIDADVPSAITDTWSSALTTHIGKRIEIATKRKLYNP